jgi:signal transduction histidine kinase
MPLNLFALTDEQQRDKTNMDLYRVFVRLMNYGQEKEFHEAAKQYEDFLKQNGLLTEYFKIKTNEGFFDIRHRDMLRAFQIATELREEMKTVGREDLSYLATGLEGDLHKAMRSHKADSIYKQALKEVGDTDPKFAMLVHMSLAQINYMTNSDVALEWANLAIKEAEELNNIEHRSMGLGMKGYIYFMIGKQEEFMQTKNHYNALKAEFEQMEKDGKALGRQRFSHRYDKILELGELAFDGKFDEALDIVNSGLEVVDPQMVLYRIYGMEGTREKEMVAQKLRWWLIGLTSAYIFVYFMGRRRLMRKIWKRERELKQALKDADAANRMKSAFIRSMSHEIRTPLNAINGFSQIICADDVALSADEREDIKNRITSSTEAITIIINELLEMAAGESVTLDINDLTPVNINEVCRVALIQAQNHNTKGLHLDLDTELPDSFYIRSNEETIAQILEKIIDNALKFTDEGSVNIHIKEEANNVVISVTDTGIGVPEEQKEAIFERFVKLNDFSEGIGLGLSISQRLAKSLGGRIELDSNYKDGSRFKLLLPVVK